MRPYTWHTAVVLVLLPVAALLVAGCADRAAPTAEVVVPEGNAEAATDTPEPGVLFLAGDRLVQAGECTTLEWEVAGALRTYLDGKGVDDVGSEQVCPSKTTTYTITAAMADGSEIERQQVVQVPVEEEPTTEPTEPEPTAAAPTRAPVTATSTVTPTLTASPVSIEFYPDNNIYEIEKDDKCTAVAWRTSGVTNLQLEREGMGRKDVGAQGREEVCFETQKVMLFLYYRTPEGKEERAEIMIRRKS